MVERLQSPVRIVETAILEAPTIGELIAAWGIPIGFARYGRAINVHWRSRYAYLITCTLHPDSPVERIVYHREAYWTSPWRGFANSKDYKC